MRFVRWMLMLLGVGSLLGCQVKYSTLDAQKGKMKEINVGTPEGYGLGVPYAPYGGLPYGYGGGPYGFAGRGTCQPLVTYPLGPDMPPHIVDRTWVFVLGRGYQCEPISP